MDSRLIIGQMQHFGYYPFGMLMPRRNFNAEKYRYGFNGHEKNDEVSGSGNSADMGDRWLDVRL